MLVCVHKSSLSLGLEARPDRVWYVSSSAWALLGCCLIGVGGSSIAMSSDSAGGKVSSFLRFWGRTDPARGSWPVGEGGWLLRRSWFLVLLVVVPLSVLIWTKQNVWNYKCQKINDFCIFRLPPVHILHLNTYIEKLHIKSAILRSCSLYGK